MPERFFPSKFLFLEDLESRNFGILHKRTNLIRSDLMKVLEKLLKKGKKPEYRSRTGLFLNDIKRNLKCIALFNHILLDCK